MADNAKPRHDLIPNHRPRRTKVKSGCRTCKLRKVKCDEGRPVCKRCSSTGRVCDGYGVWGGGGNFYGNRQQQQQQQQQQSAIMVPPLYRAYGSMLVLNEDETRCFEWYQCRTRNKIPGLFVLTFWNTILIPASLHEPAVLHAVLALSSVHESGVIFNASAATATTHWGCSSSDALSKKERFVLEHYTKAIGHLQSHLSATDRMSIRFALVTCVIFVCLEVLRGRFRTALHHLESGLKVLGEIQQHQLGFIDDGILEVFSRLSIQLALLDQNYQHLDLSSIDSSRPKFPCQVFYTFNQAWQWLECILYKILRLTKYARQQQSPPDFVYPDLHLDLFENQQELIAELKSWLDAYEASRENLQGLFTRDVESFGCQLLYCYHNIAEIMAGTCLRNHDDESIFDSYTDVFVVMINGLASLADRRMPQVSVPTTSSSHDFNMSRSVVDIGWIPALYYVAIKCRVHRIRLQAIKLLEYSIHREGIWDARISACIARKVMEIEERDFYESLINNDDDFAPSSPLELQDLTLPPLPDCYRVHDVKVVLPNGPTENMFLSCRQRDPFGGWKVVTNEYSVQQQKWVDT